MTTLTIVPPCAFINANDRLHHHAKAKLTRTWREAGRLHASASPRRAYDHAHVVCSIRFPDDIRRDVGNWYPTAKAILDGIVTAGRHLADDSDEHVTGPDMRRIRPNGSPLVVITITEVSP